MERHSTPFTPPVHPVSLLFALFAAAAVADAVHELDEGEEHGDNDAADNHGEEHNHDWLQKRGHGGDGVIDFIVIVVGDFEKHFGQRAGLFADIDHANDHRREDAGSLEGGRDGFALFYALMNASDSIADNDVAGGFFHDGKRLEDGHTAADQRAQGPREPGN